MVNLTERELAVTILVLSAAIEDEEPGDFRAAMRRAANKLREAVRANVVVSPPTLREP